MGFVNLDEVNTSEIGRLESERSELSVRETNANTIDIYFECEYNERFHRK